MTVLIEPFRSPPAQHFFSDAVFGRAFAALRQALDAQQLEMVEEPSRWISRYGKGGPGYPDYRPVCLAQHCLDVGFVASLILVMLWCSGALDAHGVGEEDKAAMETLLKRIPKQ